jgi:hypothetical protein
MDCRFIVASLREKRCQPVLTSSGFMCMHADIDCLECAPTGYGLSHTTVCLLPSFVP